MNRIMKWLLSFVLAFNMIQFTPVFAEEDPTEPEQPQIEEVVVQTETVTEEVTEEIPVVTEEVTEEEGPKLTYHDVDVDVDASKFAVKRTVPVNKGEIPASYDLRDHGWVSPVKNQNPYGTCWSFALMATAESNILYKQLESDPDLSELQMAYWMYNRTNDPLGLTKGDKTTVEEGFLDAGGNDYLATFALAGGLGYVDEELAPYTLAITMGPSLRLKSRLAYQSNSYRLTEAKWMYMSDTDTIKEALMNGGAVAVSYYHSEVFLKYIWDQEEVTEAVYNSAQHHKGSTNHAVTLVGWDDNFDRNKFNTKPSANGAWLIKNSWGEDWGKDGYFWISYEDMSLMSGLACQYTVVKADENENIYQYDGTISASTYLNTNSSTISAANVYTATRNEVLHSAGFFTDADNVDYTVSACLLNGNPSDPEDAVFCLSTSGTAAIPGYHEVELSSPMNIEKGQAFSIIVTLTPDENSGDPAYMYVNESGDYGWISFTNKVTEGTSYIYNFLGEETWDDISALCHAEARIKAYTYAAPDYDSAHVDVDPVLNVGDIRTLHPSFYPDFGNPDSIYWKSSDEHVVKVENGTIYACAPGTACVGVCSKKTDEWIGCCFVDVVQPITSVESSADYIVVPTGGSVELSAWVMPEDHTERNSYICWESADEYVVTVDRQTTCGANDMQTVRYVSDGKTTIYAQSVERPDIYKEITVFSGTPYETKNLTDVQYELNATVRSYNSVNLTWKTQENVTGYYIYRATSATGKLTKIATVPMGSETYTDKSLTTGKTYYYAIRAYYTRLDGTKTISAYSDRVKGKAVPFAPSYVQTEAKTKAIKVSWGKASGASGYEVYRATSYDGTYKKVATVSSKYTYYTNKSLTANKVYFYKVRAYRTVSGKKVYSSFTTPIKGYANPSAPTELKTSVVSSSALKISWKQVSGASMYGIYRYDGSEYERIGWYLDNGWDGYETYDTTDMSGPSIWGHLTEKEEENTYAFVDYNCEFGKEYQYKVKAFGNVYYEGELLGFTESSYSSSVTAKTSVKVVRSNRYSYPVSLVEVTPFFMADAEETGYQLQRKTSSGSYKTVYTGTSAGRMHGNEFVADNTFKPGSTYYYRVRAYVVKDGVTTYYPWSSSKKVTYKILDYAGTSKWPKMMYLSDHDDIDQGGYIRVTKASVSAYNIDKENWTGDFKFTFTYDKRYTPDTVNRGEFEMLTMDGDWIIDFTVGKLAKTGTFTVWVRDMELGVIGYCILNDMPGVNLPFGEDSIEFTIYETDSKQEPLPGN